MEYSRMSGGVIIARSLWDDAAFQNEPFSEREAWVWMICEAQWKPREKRVGKVIVTVDRGQLAHSTRFLSEAWKWTHSKVRRFLDRLEKLNLIRRESGTGVSVISLCKYNEYQLSPQSSGTVAAQKRHSSGTNLNKDEIREEGYKIDADASVPILRDQSPKCDAREIADILEAWASPSAVASFLAYRRKRKGGAMTLTAAKRQASQLKVIFQGNGDTDDALGMAEERGWQSVQADWYFNAKGKENDTRTKKPSFSATLHAALDASPVGASLIDRSKRDPFAGHT